jgi:uncharacterized protein (DUF58 family)
MQSGKQEYREYLEPKVLAKISGLELRARMIIEGFFSGMHHSPHRGLSIEFADHRVYTQGDDIRHMDWKVYGRTDKYYIKEYEQEANLNLMLAVDCSESMDYSSREGMLTKHDYATAIAAATAYLALQQQDSVGLALFDEQVTEFIRPSNNVHHWKTLIRELAGKTGPAKTSMDRVFPELAERLTKRMLVIIISDLFDEPDVILKGIKSLRYHRHDLIVWNLWDQAELTFLLKGPTLFEGLESMGRLRADPGSLRAKYLTEVERFQTRMRRACGKMHVDYSVFNTSLPLDAALSGYLATRSARLKKRSSRVMGSG